MRVREHPESHDERIKRPLCQSQLEASPWQGWERAADDACGIDRGPFEAPAETLEVRESSPYRGNVQVAFVYRKRPLKPNGDAAAHGNTPPLLLSGSSWRPG